MTAFTHGRGMAVTYTQHEARTRTRRGHGPRRALFTRRWPAVVVVAAALILAVPVALAAGPTASPVVPGQRIDLKVLLLAQDSPAGGGVADAAQARGRAP